MQTQFSHLVTWACVLWKREERMEQQSRKSFFQSHGREGGQISLIYLKDVRYWSSQFVQFFILIPAVALTKIEYQREIFHFFYTRKSCKTRQNFFTFCANIDVQVIRVSLPLLWSKVTSPNPPFSTSKNIYLDDSSPTQSVLGQVLEVGTVLFNGPIPASFCLFSFFSRFNFNTN